LKEERSPDEANVSAEHAPAKEDSWVQAADEDAGRPQRLETAPGEGAKAPDRIARATSAPSGRFHRRERLTRPNDFQVVFQQGTRIERPSMIVLWKPNDRARRVGFAVSRQTRGAVTRNRARRRLREAYRAARPRAPLGVDLVVVARGSALRAPLGRLIQDMTHAFGQIAARLGPETA
jgi:ribonuclease P protein component